MFGISKKHIANFVKEKLNSFSLKEIISSFKNNMLIRSIEHSNLFLCKLSLKIGADINCKNTDGKTLLDVAINNIKIKKSDTEESMLEKKRKMIKFLFDNGIDINNMSNDLTALQIACNTNDINLIKVILAETGSKINLRNADGSTALINACSNDFSEVAEELLLHGGDPSVSDEYGITALHAAIKKRNTPLVRSILQNGNDIYNFINLQDSKGNSPLIYACDMQCTEIVYILLTNGANPNDYNFEGQTPIHIAFRKKNYRIINLLLTFNADINKKVGKDRQTILHNACMLEDYDWVSFLIDKGANVNIKTNSGWTPLHYACYYNNWDIVNILLKNNADVFAKTTEEFTPLGICLENNYYDICKGLIGYNTNLINEIYDNNWRIIHYAVRNNWIKFVHFLYEVGVDLEAKTRDDMTPIKIAAQYGNREILCFLNEKIRFAKKRSNNRIEYSNSKVKSVYNKLIYNESITEKDHVYYNRTLNYSREIPDWKQNYQTMNIINNTDHSKNYDIAEPNITNHRWDNRTIIPNSRLDMNFSNNNYNSQLYRENITNDNDYNYNNIIPNNYKNNIINASFKMTIPKEVSRKLNEKYGLDEDGNIILTFQ